MVAPPDASVVLAADPAAVRGGGPVDGFALGLVDTHDGLGDGFDRGTFPAVGGFLAVDTRQLKRVSAVITLENRLCRRLLETCVSV